MTWIFCRLGACFSMIRCLLECNGPSMQICRSMVNIYISCRFELMCIGRIFSHDLVTCSIICLYVESCWYLWCFLYCIFFRVAEVFPFPAECAINRIIVILSRRKIKHIMYFKRGKLSVTCLYSMQMLSLFYSACIRTLYGHGVSLNITLSYLLVFHLISVLYSPKKKGTEVGSILVE